MTGKPLPPEPLVPWWTLTAWRAWALITWPRDVRKLKREGWRRTGWMQWESPGGTDVQ